MADTQAKLKLKADEAAQKKSAADSSLAQRQTRLEETFKKGRAYYDQGQYREALSEWKSILPELEDQQTLSPLIAQAESAQAALESVKRDADRAAERAQAKLVVPAGLAQALQETQARLRAAQTESVALQAKADARAKNRQDSVDAAFAKGEVFYREGKIAEALGAWRALTPEVQGGESLAAEIDRVERLNNDLLTAQKAVADTAKRQPLPPSGLTETLAEVDRSIQIRRTQADQQRLSSDTDFKARQEAAAATYRQGRELFVQGKTKEALNTWRSLLPVVDDAKTLRSLIDTAEDSYIKMLEAENAAADAARLRPEAPKDLQEFLGESIRKTKEATLKAESDLARTRKGLAERQAIISATVREGTQLYNQGRIDDAIEVWKRLSGDVDATAPVMAQIDALKHNYRMLNDAETAYKAVRSVDKISDFPGADKMTDFIEEANLRMQSDIEEYRGKTSQSQKAVEEREAWMSATARNGIAFYEKGRIADALEQWDRLLPYLQEDSLLARRIQELRDSYDQMAEAEESLESAETDQKNYEFPDSDELSGYLEDAKVKLDKNTEAARSRAYETEQGLSDRKQWFNDVYQKGKAYYEEGRYIDAVREWEALTPHMSGPIQNLIRQARQKAREAGQTGPDSLPASMPVSHRGEVEEESPAPPPVSSSRRSQATVAPSGGGFVTGAVVSADGTSITLRLYSGKPDDRLTVKHDGGTRIEGTDKKPSDLAPGTVVDLRYDPSSNVADSIQVY
ncbi:MAG: hypothetical protein MOGMAGMI_00148 [Candidatus Omnitrophica bacterium]|nr:hypothetical protein [Candidatus Omnitrophota bacterium]